MLAFMRILILIFKPNALFIFWEIWVTQVIIQSVNAAEIVKQAAADIGPGTAKGIVKPENNQAAGFGQINHVSKSLLGVGSMMEDTIAQSNIKTGRRETRMENIHLDKMGRVNKLAGGEVLGYLQGIKGQIGTDDKAVV